ncbi:hypothetical protein E2C01_026095 [Portunus trituberculatus]|uniref:Uncharacterized protein n=1 Tax=Portunus trituberculatus TaxID=210409 RepID=A0A5B7EHG6_PORTR|nr:hypothetical protein [Portunus trituberculatus]
MSSRQRRSWRPQCTSARASGGDEDRRRRAFLNRKYARLWSSSRGLQGKKVELCALITSSVWSVLPASCTATLGKHECMDLDLLTKDVLGCSTLQMERLMPLRCAVLRLFDGEES